MGLIYNTKKFFEQKEKTTKPTEDKNFESIEYHLICLGELRAPYLGFGPEHDINARWILREGPYRLFSVTEIDRIPQELCLTFDCHFEEKKIGSAVIIGPPIEEVTREFSAFLSLVSRRRISLLSLRRRENYPVDESPYNFSAYYGSEDVPINRSVPYGLSKEGKTIIEPIPQYNPHKEIPPTGFDDLLTKLIDLEETKAETFVLSMRLYHAALENMYLNTDVAYLLLVSAIDAAASIEFKRDSNRIRFKKFINKYLPGVFWSEEDDFYLMSRYWNSFYKNEECLDKYLDKIYDKRSAMLHEGIPFPSSIDLGLKTKVKAEAAMDFVSSRDKQHENQESIVFPNIIWFERAVNYCLLGFLCNQG